MTNNSDELIHQKLTGARGSGLCCFNSLEEKEEEGDEKEEEEDPWKSSTASRAIFYED